MAATAGAYLAKAYAAMGRLDDAMEAAERANTDLPPTSDPPVEALVRHTAVQIIADSGDTGAASGLQYARAITRGWWAERLRGLYAVRSALATHDLSIRHDAEWRAAREDPLTGVGNRRALDERMAAALDSGRSVAVLAIDVDNLKVVNDSHGHACGDEVLRRVAQLLTEQCRAEDVVARAGGDEFVVVLDNPDERGARELVERIRAAAERVAGDAEEPWFAHAPAEYRPRRHHRRDGGRRPPHRSGPPHVRREAPPSCGWTASPLVLLLGVTPSSGTLLRRGF